MITRSSSMPSSARVRFTDPKKMFICIPMCNYYMLRCFIYHKGFVLFYYWLHVTVVLIRIALYQNC